MIPAANRVWYRNKHTGAHAYVKTVRDDIYFLYNSEGYVGPWDKDRFERDWERTDPPTWWEYVKRKVKSDDRR